MVGDVDGRIAIIIDDMISTGETLVLAAELLKERGAGQIYAAATHGIFAGNALSLIGASAIGRVFITDSIPLPPVERHELIEVVSIAPLLAEAIMRIHKDMSVSALFV